MKGKTSSKKTRFNLFQRLSIGFILIFSSITILLTISFCTYYRMKAWESKSSTIQMASEIKAKDIAAVFNRIEVAAESIGGSTSGLNNQLSQYIGDTKSCILAFQNTRDLLSNYMSIAIRPITLKYHVCFFPDASFDLTKELSATDLDRIFLDGMTWLYSDYGWQDYEWFQSAKEFPNKSHWFTLDDDKNILYMVRGLQYLTVKGSVAEQIRLGVILIEMDTSWMEKYMDNTEVGMDTQFWVLGEDGQILYARDQDFCGRDASELMGNVVLKKEESEKAVTIQGKQYLTEITKLNNKLKLVTLIPSMELKYFDIRTLSPFFILLFIGLLSGIFFSITLSHRITSPVLRLAQHMRGNPLSHISGLSSVKDEDMQYLYQSYENLISQVEESMKRREEYLEHEKELELNVLQAQMNPHFLCNSLNSMYNVAVLKEEKTIADAISELCVFLRYNISRPTISISLQRELEMIESYISIQNFILGDRIFFEYDMEVDCERTKISKMLLQPLVENCIMHGLGEDIIEIKVRCHLDEIFFTIVVEDNGNTKDPDSINVYLQRETEERETKTHGFGIRNVNQRIQMKYGNQYGLIYQYGEEGGLAAHIKLPISLVVFY